MIDRKGMIIGTILGLLIGVSAVYAARLQFRYRCIIEVPSRAEVETKIDGSSDGETLEFYRLSGHSTSKLIWFHNIGSSDLTLRWYVRNLPDGLLVDVDTQFKAEGQRGGENWKRDVIYIDLPRGRTTEVTVWVRDDGIEPGTYEWVIVFEEV